MQATFLGTADGHTRMGRDHSGILLRAAEGSLLLDCGAAAARFLLEKKLLADVPDGVWLSHAHSDHIGQFPMLVQSLWLRRRRAPLHVYAPQPLLDTLRGYLESCLLFEELLGFPLVWHPVGPGTAFRQGPFRLTPFATDHLLNLAGSFRAAHPGTCFACYGVTIAYQKERFVYSADLALPRDLAPALRKPVRALFCELSHFPEHLLFEQLAGKPVAALWITHYPDALQGREAALRKLARDCGFAGQVRLAGDRRHVLFSTPTEPRKS